MRISLAFMTFLIISSCSFFGVNLSKDDEKKVREMIDGSTINIQYRENHDRIFANYFYDMTENHDREDKKTPISAELSINFTKIPSGTDTSGVIMYYEIMGLVPYSVNIDKVHNRPDEVVFEVEKYKKFKSQRQRILRDVSNKDHKDRVLSIKKIFSGKVISSQRYAGSPADLFAEYTAELNAKENLAKDVAREFYYGLILNLRLHILQCKKLKSVLLAKRFFIFANEDDKTDEEDVSDYTIFDIEIDSIKRRDYLIYEDSCTFF